jgi:hypothetical protein
MRIFEFKAWRNHYRKPIGVHASMLCLPQRSNRTERTGRGEPTHS